MGVSVFYFTDNHGNQGAFPKNAELQIVSDSSHATLQWMGLGDSQSPTLTGGDPNHYSGDYFYDGITYHLTCILDGTMASGNVTDDQETCVLDGTTASGNVTDDPMTGPLAGTWTADSTPPGTDCIGKNY